MNRLDTLTPPHTPPPSENTKTLDSWFKIQLLQKIQKASWDELINIIDQEFEFVDGNIIVNSYVEYQKNGLPLATWLTNLHKGKELELKKILCLLSEILGFQPEEIKYFLKKFENTNPYINVILRYDSKVNMYQHTNFWCQLKKK